MTEKTIFLNNGLKIPLVGLGVWQATAGECYKAVRLALDEGYRHIDTAKIYGNEKEVGKAVKDSKIDRQDIFITTKLWNTDHEKAESVIDESLKNLVMDYVDMYLVHFPVTATRNKAWLSLQKIHKSGKVKSIGVSNYTIRHLKELLDSTEIIPAVNQIEFHPWLYQHELKSYCEASQIRVQAYSPLAHGEKVNDPALTQIAKKYNRSNAQILIRWSLQKENIVLPKSVNPDRIRENYQVFDFTISQEDVNLLDDFHVNLRTCWDPSKTP